MAIKYTPKRIAATLRDLEKLEQLQKESQKKMSQLKHVFRRIQAAMHPDIEKYYLSELEAAEAQLKEELKEVDPDSYRYPSMKRGIKSRARIRVIKASVYYPLMPHEGSLMPRWDSFLNIAKRVHKKDRAEYIKKGEIKA